jgi:hypothetical protein
MTTALPMPAAATERLAALITAKRDALELVARLSRQQLELVRAGEMTWLIKLLAAKQTMLGQLQAIERELASFRDDDPEERRWSSPEARAACQADADRCNALLAGILQLESQSEAAMQAHRDAAAAALVTTQGATDARQAYRALPATAGSSLHFEG